MRCIIKELMDNLGVGYTLSAYETAPWSVYDDDDGITCSAEVRMGSDADEIEAEIQFMYDEPPAGKQAVEHVFWLLAKPAAGDKWDVKTAKVKGEDKTADIFQWEEKAVEFFFLCVQEIQADKIPDIDEIYEKTINRKDKFGGGGSGGGRKGQKFSATPAMKMKGGGGM